MNKQREDPAAWIITAPTHCTGITKDRGVGEYWMERGEAVPLYLHPPTPESARIEQLEDTMRWILATADSNDDPDEIRSEIYSVCKEAGV